MSPLRQAAQQALEAWFRPHGINYVDFRPYMEALRAALAEPQTTHWEGCEAVHPECRKPEQKPVAWMSNKDFNPIRIRIMSEAYDFADRGDSEGYNAIKVMCGDVQRMLPPQRKPLTEEEIVRLMVGEDRVQLLYAKPDDPYFSEFAQGAIRELVESGRAIERAHGIGEQHE